VADGLRVAIIGKPNVGKSTLLNALAGSEAAIVTPHAGTTRDLIEVRLDLAGFPIILTDTAGLRETEDPVERIGVARALRCARTADVVLLLAENGSSDAIAALLQDSGGFEESRLIRIRTKSDLLPVSDSRFDLDVSALTGAGMDELKARLAGFFDSAGPQEGILITRERQHLALTRALAACRRARTVDPALIELKDHEVRVIEDMLDVLIGKSGVEDVLGAVFSRFCIGK
jgi:tRNA modification GTPase